MIRRPPRSTLLTHSFPTRRSSDLIGGRNGLNFPELWPELWNVTRPLRRPDPTRDDARRPWRFTTPKPPSASVCEPYSRLFLRRSFLRRRLLRGSLFRRRFLLPDRKSVV